MQLSPNGDWGAQNPLISSHVSTVLWFQDPLGVILSHPSTRDILYPGLEEAYIISSHSLLAELSHMVLPRGK